MKRTGFSLVEERIQWTRKQLAKIDSAISVSKDKLNNTLIHDDLKTCERMVNRSTELIFIKCKSKQLTKFEKLKKTTMNQTNNNVQPRVNVVNLSNRELSNEEKVLSLGLNFAITPRSLPKEKIIQEIEPALAKLPTEHGYKSPKYYDAPNYLRVT